MNLADCSSIRTPRLRWIAFVVIGTLAAAVHFAVALILIRAAHLPPLIANLLGWMTAFFVSLSGHLRLTFGDRPVKKVGTAGMFLAVSLTGLAMNELSFWLLMKRAFDIRLALVSSMLLAALLTYLLSDYWAFRSEKAVHT